MIKVQGSYILRRMKCTMYPRPMGGALRRHHGQNDDTLGLALVGALGFGAGLLVGLVGGGLLGDVDANRVRSVVHRFRSDEESSEDGLDEEPERTENDLLAMLESNPATRGLNLEVHSLGGGLIEITGIAPDQRTRELAGELARGVVRSAVVVNRVLVEGTDTKGETAVSP